MNRKILKAVLSLVLGVAFSWRFMVPRFCPNLPIHTVHVKDGGAVPDLPCNTKEIVHIVQIGGDGRQLYFVCPQRINYEAPYTVEWFQCEP